MSWQHCITTLCRQSVWHIQVPGDELNPENGMLFGRYISSELHSDISQTAFRIVLFPEFNPASRPGTEMVKRPLLLGCVIPLPGCLWPLHEYTQPRCHLFDHPCMRSYRMKLWLLLWYFRLETASKVQRRRIAAKRRMLWRRRATSVKLGLRLLWPSSKEKDTILICSP